MKISQELSRNCWLQKWTASVQSSFLDCSTAMLCPWSLMWLIVLDMPLQPTGRSLHLLSFLFILWLLTPDSLIPLKEFKHSDAFFLDHSCCPDLTEFTKKSNHCPLNTWESTLPMCGSLKSCLHISNLKLWSHKNYLWTSVVLWPQNCSWHLLILLLTILLINSCSSKMRANTGATPDLPCSAFQELLNTQGIWSLQGTWHLLMPDDPYAPGSLCATRIASTQRDFKKLGKGQFQGLVG